MTAFNESWQTDRALEAARTFCRRSDLARKWGVGHFWFPAWARIKRVLHKLPSDQGHAARLARLAGRRGCQDELRQITEHRLQFRMRTVSLQEWFQIKGESPPIDRRLLAIWFENRDQRLRLSMKQRLWLYLRHVEQWDLVEIADAFGTNEDYVSRVNSLAVQEMNQTS